MSVDKRSKCIILNYFTKTLNRELIKSKLKDLNFINVSFYESDTFSSKTTHEILSEESKKEYSHFGCLVVCIFASIDNHGNFLCIDSDNKQEWFHVTKLIKYFNPHSTLNGRPKFFFLNDGNEDIKEVQQNDPFLFLYQNVDILLSFNRYSDHQMLIDKLCSTLVQQINNRECDLDQVHIEMSNDITEVSSFWRRGQSEINSKCTQFNRFLLNISSDCFTNDFVLIGRSVLDCSNLYDNREKGKLIILNCQTFDSNQVELSQSTTTFVSSVQDTFRHLNFELSKPIHNFSKEELRTELGRVNKSRHSYSCLVLCIITHGGEQNLYCRNEMIDLNNFINEHLTDDKMKKLAGKPKFLFIQDSHKIAVRNDKVANMMPSFDKLPFYTLPNDFLLFHCTHQVFFVPEQKTMLNSVIPTEVLYKGSWTIQPFCEALRKYADKYDLLTIMKIIFFANSNNYRAFDSKICLGRNCYIKSSLKKMFFLNIANHQTDQVTYSISQSSPNPQILDQMSKANEIPKLLCKRDALYYNLNRTGFTRKFVLLNYIDLKQNLKIDQLVCLMKRTFEKFHFEIHNEMTKIKSEEVLKKESVNLELNCKYDCFIVFVLTNGDTSQVMDKEQMLDLFVDSPGLRGKPKLFFIQAFANQNHVSSGDIQHDSFNFESRICLIPKYADFLVFNSPFSTTAFMQTLCDVIGQYSAQIDLMRMLTMICGRLSSETNCKQKQIPYINSTLTRLVSFKLSSQKTINEIVNSSTQTDLFYLNSHKKIGRCVILNYDSFDLLKQRKGTEIDVHSIKSTFCQYGFEVIDRHNLKREQTLAFLKSEARPIDSDFDYFVLFVLTHGENNQRLWCKDTLIGLEEILDSFSDQNCSVLKGKPRIVFVQACQGTRLDEGVLVEEPLSHDSSGSDHNFRIADHFLVIFSSFPGFVSWRHTEKGTWFIQSLCRVIDKYSFDYDLLTMLSMVCQEVAYKYRTHNPDDNEIDLKKQIPYINSTLQALVSLNFETIPLNYLFPE